MPGPPALVTDGDAIAFQERLAGERLGVVEQVLHRAGADDAALLERRVVGRLGAGQRAGVRGDRLRAGAGRARLDRDDRLVAGDLAGDADELRPVADPFQIGHDGPRFGILGPGFHQVQLVDVGLVADAVEPREADALAHRQVEDRGAERARLRHEGDPAAVGHAGRERCVELEHRVDDAQHVGAHHPHPIAVADFDDLLFERAALGADFAEAGRDDDRALEPALAALFHHRGHRFVRHQDHGQIHRIGAIQHRWVRLQPQNVGGRRVDRIDATLVAISHDVVKNLITQLVRAGGGAYNRNASRFGKHFEHGFTSRR